MEERIIRVRIRERNSKFFRLEGTVLYKYPSGWFAVKLDGPYSTMSFKESEFVWLGEEY
jgi:hypothetical protein